MNLNDVENFDQVDSKNLIDSISAIPDAIHTSFDGILRTGEPEKSRYDGVAILATGHSAAAAEIFLSSTEIPLNIPILVFEKGDLPEWVAGERWLVIAISFQIKNFEVEAMLAQAVSRSCSVAIITKQGSLEANVKDLNLPLYLSADEISPFLSVGHVFGMLERVFSDHGFLETSKATFIDASNELKVFSQTLDIKIAAALNPAKRMAGQLVEKYPLVFGAEHLAPVARMWKTQINLMAKSVCGFETIPEANHSSLSGLSHPGKLLASTFAMFLQSDNYSSVNQNRMDQTFTEYMVAGSGTDLQRFPHAEKRIEVWKAALFGIYTAYYLAILLDMDPGSTDTIEMFNAQFS